MHRTPELRPHRPGTEMRKFELSQFSISAFDAIPVSLPRCPRCSGFSPRPPYCWTGDSRLTSQGLRRWAPRLWIAALRAGCGPSRRGRSSCRVRRRPTCIARACSSDRMGGGSRCRGRSDALHARPRHSRTRKSTADEPERDPPVATISSCRRRPPSTSLLIAQRRGWRAPGLRRACFARYDGTGRPNTWSRNASHRDRRDSLLEESGSCVSQLRGHPS